MLESTGEKPEEQEAYASELLRELSAEEKTRETARELSWLQEVLRDYGISTEGYRVKDEILKRIMRRIMSYLENGEERESFELQSLRRDLEEHLKNYLTMSGSDRQEEENAYVLQEIQEYYYSCLLYTSRELRGGAALCIAAAGTCGESRISQYPFIARGYENIIRDLQGLGVVIH